MTKTTEVTVFRIVGLVPLLGVIGAAAPADHALRSATLAKQLTAALTEQKLDAIAAKDPEESDRFVAALFYPNAQLLVISARYSAPQVLQARLANKQYRDIYLDLGSAALTGSSVFFQDMKADGLCSGRDQTADLVYGRSPMPTVFDGDWSKHNLSEKEYVQQLTAADEKYSRLLEVLLAELQLTSDRARIQTPGDPRLIVGTAVAWEPQ